MVRSSILLQGLASHGYLVVSFFILRLKQFADLVRNKFSFVTALLMQVQFSHCLQQLYSSCHWLIYCSAHMFVENSILEAGIQGSANVLIGELEVKILLDCSHRAGIDLHKF